MRCRRRFDVRLHRLHGAFEAGDCGLGLGVEGELRVILQRRRALACAGQKLRFLGCVDRRRRGESDVDLVAVAALTLERAGEHPFALDVGVRPEDADELADGDLVEAHRVRRAVLGLGGEYVGGFASALAVGQHLVVDLDDREHLRAVGNPQRDGDAVLLSESVEGRHGGDLLRGVKRFDVGQDRS